MENMKDTFTSLEELECGSYVEKRKQKPSSYLDKVVKRSISSQEKPIHNELSESDQLEKEKKTRTMMDEAFDQLIEKTKDLTGKSWADIFDDESDEPDDDAEKKEQDDIDDIGDISDLDLE